MEVAERDPGWTARDGKNQIVKKSPQAMPGAL